MTTNNAINTGTVFTVTQGGIGATTAAAGFDNLSPLTTKGDLVYFNGTNNIRLPVGVDQMNLIVDSSSGPVWDVPGSISYNSSIVLTSSQVKNLKATPIQVLAAPGAGYINIVIDMMLKLTYGGTNAFTGGQSCKLFYGTSSGPIGSPSMATTNLLQVSATTYSGFTGFNQQYLAASTSENTALVIANIGAAEITGNAANNNTLTVTLNYITVSI